MEENKPIHNEEEVTPPNNPQDAVREQALNTSSTDESIVPAAKTTTEAEQPQTINLSTKALAKADYKPETENMGVHQHTITNWADNFL